MTQPKTGAEATIRTTIRLPQTLWDAIRRRAIDEHCDAQDIVKRALEQFLSKRKGSTLLWCAYYLRGKEYRESTGETDPNKAEKYLKRRLKEVGADQIGAKP